MPDPTGTRFEETPSGISSIKEATFEHQAWALAHGYSSVRDALVDETAAAVRDLRARVEALEQDIAPLSADIEET